MISFLTYSSLILGSWTESYPGNDIPPNLYRYNQIDQYIPTSSNFYVSQVTFTTINEVQGNGGAICATVTAKLLVESSNFILCQSGGLGGAIYFSNATGRSYLKKVCSTNSRSTANFYHFCNIYTKNSSICTNCIEHSSIAKLNSPTSKDTNVHLRNSGVIILKYNNISKNRCAGFSTFGCVPSISSSVSYSSFENDTSTVFEILRFDNKQKHDMKACNVIGNDNGNKNNRAIIWISGSLSISDSCLIENKDAMFYFTSNTDSCTITNCTIDRTDKVGGGSVIDNNSIPIESFINNFDNDRCFSANDDTGDSNMCKTFKMIGNVFNVLRKKENYILTI